MSIASLNDSMIVRSHEHSTAWQFFRTDLLIAILSVISVVAFVGSREIDGVRERRLAGATADIVRHGHWLLPNLRGEPRFLKPLLANWMAAASMTVFGWSEFSFRLPTALCGLGTVALGYVLGRRLLGASGGRITALVLVTTRYFVGECHSASTDMPLTFFASAALVSWWIWQQRAIPWSRAWWCMYLSLSAACLTKGPVALAIFSVPVVLEIWAGRRWELVRRMRIISGAVVVAAPLVVWVATVCSQLDDALGLWWGDMQLAFSNKHHATVSNYFSHLAKLPLFSFPWSVLSVASLGAPLLRRSLPAWPAIRFVYFWFAGLLAFFSTWAMQPMHYLLPLTLPLAVVEAALIERAIELLQSRSARWYVAHAARLVCLTFIGFALWTAGAVFWRASGSALCVGVILAILAFPAVAALLRLIPSPRQSLASLAMAGVICVVLFSAWIDPAISHVESCARFSSQLNATVPAGEPVYFSSMQEALAFYSDRRFSKVAIDDLEPDEAVFGLRPGFLLLCRGRFEKIADCLERRYEIEELAKDCRITGRERPGDILLLRLRARPVAGRVATDTERS